MKRGIITLIFQKGSAWKGELYPCFDCESEEKLFNKKRAKVQKLLRKIEKILNH